MFNSNTDMHKEELTVSSLEWVQINETDSEHLFSMEEQWILSGKQDFPIILSKDEMGNIYCAFKEKYCGILNLSRKIIRVEPNKAPLNLKDYLLLWLYNYDENNIKINEISGIDLGIEGMMNWIFSRFLDEVEEIFSKGIISNYNNREAYLPYKQGDIDFIKSEFSYNNQLYCKYDELSIINPINEFIKTVLLKIEKYIIDSNALKIETIKNKIRYISRLFDSVPPLKDPEYNIESEPAIYSPPVDCEFLIQLGIFIIKEISVIDLGTTENIISPFFINVDVIFEEFIQKILQLNLPYMFKMPEKETFGIIYMGTDTIKEKEFVPDGLLIYQQEIFGIIDTKNKPNGYFANPDIYQMISYSIFTNAKFSILIYPTKNSKEMKKLILKNKNINANRIYSLSFEIPSNPELLLDCIDQFIHEIVEIIELEQNS